MFIDNAAAGRVLRLTLAIDNEESLTYPLVDNDDRDFRLDRCLVVNITDRILELRDFYVEHLVALSVSNTVTVNYKVGGEFSLVVLSEGFYGRFNRLNHLFLDYLLALGLDQVITEVLTQIRVDAC